MLSICAIANLTAISDSHLSSLLDPPPILGLSLIFLTVVILHYVVKNRQRLYLLLVTTALCLAALEAICRVLSVGDPGVATWIESTAHDIENRHLYEPNSSLIYTYPANPRGYFDEENRVLGTINAQGFRGPTREPEKSPDSTRILLLGDSFTLGIGVRDEHTLDRFVESALGTQTASIEVMNLGITGSNTRYQQSILKDYALHYHPDVIVMVMFPNDAQLKGTISFLSQPVVLRRIRQRSYFLNAFVGRFEKRTTHRRLIEHYLAGYTDNHAGWREIQASLQEADKIAQAHGIRFAVALFPVLIHLDTRYPLDAVHEIVAQFCAEANIPFCDLLPAFRGQDAPALWVHPTDQHPNEIATKIAGTALATFLRQSDLAETNPSVGATPEDANSRNP
jgi:hypothetical protein